MQSNTHPAALSRHHLKIQKGLKEKKILLENFLEDADVVDETLSKIDAAFRKIHAEIIDANLIDELSDPSRELFRKLSQQSFIFDYVKLSDIATKHIKKITEMEQALVRLKDQEDLISPLELKNLLTQIDALYSNIQKFKSNLNEMIDSVNTLTEELESLVLKKNAQTLKKTKEEKLEAKTGKLTAPKKSKQSSQKAQKQSPELAYQLALSSHMKEVREYLRVEQLQREKRINEKVSIVIQNQIIKIQQEKITHLKIAASQGHLLAIAMLNKMAKKNKNAAQVLNEIGQSYEQKSNIKNALQFYQSAALARNSEACAKLAISYHHGIGLTQNLQQAVYWYKKSAKKNIINEKSVPISVALRLADFYERGNTDLKIEKHVEKSLYWYTRAAETEPLSIEELSKIYSQLIKTNVQYKEGFPFNYSDRRVFRSVGAMIKTNKKFHHQADWKKLTIEERACRNSFEEVAARNPNLFCYLLLKQQESQRASLLKGLSTKTRDNITRSLDLILRKLKTLSPFAQQRELRNLEVRGYLKNYYDATLNILSYSKNISATLQPTVKELKDSIKKMQSEMDKLPRDENYFEHLQNIIRMIDAKISSETSPALFQELKDCLNVLPLKFKKKLKLTAYSAKEGEYKEEKLIEVTSSQNKLFNLIHENCNKTQKKIKILKEFVKQSRYFRVLPPDQDQALHQCLELLKNYDAQRFRAQKIYYPETTCEEVNTIIQDIETFLVQLDLIALSAKNLLPALREAIKAEEQEKLRLKKEKEQKELEAQQLAEALLRSELEAKPISPTLLCSLLPAATVEAKSPEEMRQAISRYQRDHLPTRLTELHPSFLLNPRLERTRFIPFQVHRELNSLGFPEHVARIVVDYDRHVPEKFKTYQFPICTSVMQVSLLDNKTDLQLISVRSRQLEDKLFKQSKLTPVNLLVTSIIKNISKKPRSKLIVISGPIGGGKSTFVRYMASAISAHQSPSAQKIRPVGVYISAKKLFSKLNASRDNFLEVFTLENIIKAGVGTHLALTNLRSLVKSGSPLVLCLDGLEDIPEKDRAKFLAQFKGVVEGIPEVNTLVVGVRDYQLIDARLTPVDFCDAPIYYLNAFNKEQQQAFLSFFAPFIPADPALVSMLVKIINDVDTHWPATPLILIALLSITQIGAQPDQKKIKGIAEITHLLIDTLIEYTIGFVKSNDLRMLLTILAGLYITSTKKEKPEDKDIFKDTLEQMLLKARSHPDSFFAMLLLKLNYPLDLSVEALLDKITQDTFLLVREANGDISFFASSFLTCLASDCMTGGVLSKRWHAEKYVKYFPQEFKWAQDKHAQFREAFQAINTIQKIHFSFQNVSYLAHPDLGKLFFYVAPDWYTFLNWFDDTCVKYIHLTSYKPEERFNFLRFYSSNLTPGNECYPLVENHFEKERRRYINQFGIPAAENYFGVMKKGIAMTEMKMLGERYRATLPAGNTETKREIDPVLEEEFKALRLKRTQTIVGELPTLEFCKKSLGQDLVNVLEMKCYQAWHGEIFPPDPAFVTQLMKNYEEMCEVRDNLNEALLGDLTTETEKIKLKSVSTFLDAMIDRTLSLTLVDTPETRAEVLQGQNRALMLGRKVLGKDDQKSEAHSERVGLVSGKSLFAVSAAPPKEKDIAPAMKQTAPRK